MRAGAAVRRGGAVLGVDDAERHPAQRRGADAAGGRADRRRAGAVLRLLVVLPARPAVPARRAVGGVRAVAARVADRARAGDAAWRCSSTCWPARRRLGAARARAPRWSPRSRWRSRAGRIRSRSSLALALGALLVFERPRSWPACSAASRAAWRIEFAAYLGLGILIAYAVRPAGRGARARRRRALRGRGGARAALVLYAPVVAAAGSATRGTCWSLPAGGLHRLPVAAVPARLRRAAEHELGRRVLRRLVRGLLHFYLPLALVVGLVGVAARAGAALPARALAQVAAPCSRSAGALPAHAAGHLPHGAAGGDGGASWRRGRWRRRASPRRPAGAARPGRSRRSAAARRWRWRWRGRPWSRGSTGAGSSCAPTRPRCDLPVADGVRVRRERARAARGAVRYVRARSRRATRST